MRLALSPYLALVLTLATAANAAAPKGPASHEKLRVEIDREVRSRLSPLLTDYCKDACTLIDVEVDVEDALGESDDLGFEGLAEDGAAASAYPSHIAVVIQVDDRVSSLNRERLGSVLKNGLGTIADGAVVDLAWRPVTLPQIGQSAALEEQLKRQLSQRLTQAVDKVIDTFCPDECVLAQINVDGKLVTPDEAANLPIEQQVRDKTGTAILKLDAVDLEVAVDSNLDADTRNRILSVLKARTRFAAPVTVELNVTAFPEPYLKKQERLSRTSKDPFGLEQLRQTLRIFKEMAGTKEIVTNTSSNAQTTASESTATEARNGGGDKLSPWEWAAVALLLLALGTGAIILVGRFAGASRDARLMVSSAREAESGRSGNALSPAQAANPGRTVTDEQRREMTQRLKIEELRDELVRIFLEAPRVAKETFARLLQEEGIEETARYVHIFGHLVVFELLGDPNLQRDLYELSEYYHKSNFQFTTEDELRLLNTLRTRVTANEIRVLTRRQMDQYDFLAKLDSGQIYNLIAEEKPQVQGIVLTQLDHKRRRAVFDMYHGESKVDLMRELCRADAIPKEYLANVAKALAKKVTSRPEFDTENLRSSDILLDLLEKAGLDEQRALMLNLVRTNAEAARGIKLKLVTVEILPYLKDGYLLEIFLGLEREELVCFLAGTREHIRALVLSKAPDELSDSWLEELENVKALDEQAYRLVELKVIGRIRALANNGVINLLDVNDLVFSSANAVDLDAPAARGAGESAARVA